ncbi:fungal-specific transcription factor domain-containing protein [Phialemonium atrogriseum]|uniref:Fungal-specific transcription factor domain-containing protein n=1 Tax=Phialemonium atrogriseum TaxID=1093897 RepID=A0AAJ0FU58_9PEZI|nr:fungal-specific transcription factor domain-containing protein [Phialemonium atrogriseum]KAK1772800.1 fungal-specific transcription factor domain-containing protein [Phialemonium atrogriseum]
MAATDGHTHSRPVAIAPAPAGARSTDPGANGDLPQPTMPYTCQTCAKRKVKCDKATPICSSCRKGKLECFYQAPLPRWRKRKLSGDINERLARYERILRQHGLLPEDADTSPSIEETPEESVISLRFNEPEASKTGKLLAGQGKSRYIDSDLWHNLGDDEMQHLSVDDEQDQVVTGVSGDLVSSDPLTGAFMSCQQSLLQYHPTHEKAIMLWKTHVENVEPLCKVLHIPSTFKMVVMASQQPAMASKADECLLFAIYHFAVFSMTEEECAEKFGQSRATLMQRYHFATRQALVNASFLKTTDMSVLQTLILFLLPCRYSYDPHTYWILTGVAIRIAQRMGLHRDGEKLSLPPFDVQMRRRLFYQLLPLDGIAGQMSGTGVATMPDSWDILPPLNINDDQIWPGMTETPEEHKGATEMIFCLARSCIGKFFATAGRSMGVAGPRQFKDYNEAELAISEAEREVEEKYIRYCDIVNPLHFLTIALARCGITAMRLRIRLPKVRNRTVTDAERRELVQLSQKIIDTDTAAYAHAGLRKHLWHVKPFFLFGSWDSLILVLTNLWRADLLSPAETDAAWSRVEQVYNNHGELLEPKRALHVAFGRLTLKAWDANPPSSSVPESAFITALRSLRKANLQSREARQGGKATALDAKTDSVSPIGPSPASDADVLIGSVSGDMGLDIGNEFNPDTADWAFWDQLMQDYRVPDGEQGGFSQ